MRTAIVVQARMTSTRLPGKVLREVGGRALLDYQIERLRRVAAASEIVIATTENATDEPILALCRKLGVTTFRGSENDVLARYHGAARAVHAELVVRVTSDCPLIDPHEIQRLIEYYRAHAADYDYVTNRNSYPVGMDAEVFPFARLDDAFQRASQPYEREHVTPYLYTTGLYRLGSLELEPSERHRRWTVDTPEDFELVSRVIAALHPRKPEFTLGDIRALLDVEHPEWSALNADVRAKRLGE